MLLLIPFAIVLVVFGGGDASASPRATHEATVHLSPRSDADDAFPENYRAIDALEAGMVVRVRVDGFAEFAKGVAAQCVQRARAFQCGNAFPVQFDADGKAFFQYQVQDDFHANAVSSGSCRADAARCILAVRDEARGTTAVIDTVFVDELPPPGAIQVTPSSGLVDGQKVTVAVKGYPAGAQVNAMLCAAPDATGSRRCGAPGPTASLVVGPDGTGSTELVVDQGPLGSQRVRCGGNTLCGVSVASADVFARAPVVPVSFAPLERAAYDRNRLALGLALAAVLIGLAIWLIRRTNWSAVGEAAAPEIDDAEYADLDAIIAALPPEDDDELARSR